MGVNNPGGGGGSAQVTGSMQGTAAARPLPAAAPAGAIYWATDTGEISVNNLGQTAWQTIALTSNAGQFTGTGGLRSAAGSNISVGNGGLLDLSAVSSTNTIYKPGVVIGINALAMDMTPVGSGWRTAEGSNAKQGASALTAGAVTVANTSVTATSRIFLTGNTDGGTPGWCRVSARTAGTSFTITSSSGTDTSTIAWEIFEVG